VADIIAFLMSGTEKAPRIAGNVRFAVEIE
jgi:hypothetical protein